MLISGGRRLLLDAGETWRGKLRSLAPDWIAITHAHPDHSLGLAEGTDAPVYVSQESRDLLAHYPVRKFRIFDDGELLRLGPFRVRPYDVIHSIRAPAVGPSKMARTWSCFFSVAGVAQKRRPHEMRASSVVISFP
jgi:ribonuclease BN (tRNA processing enzyme)